MRLLPQSNHRRCMIFTGEKKVQQYPPLKQLYFKCIDAVIIAKFE